MQLSGRKITCLILIIVSLTCFTACPALTDWEYKLPNNYKVVHINIDDIHLSKERPSGNGGDAIVGRFILEFCNNDRYVGVKRVSDEGYDSFDIDEADLTKLEYYIVDTLEDAVYGPFTEEEYNEQLSVLQINDLGDWIKTSDVN